ncbi:MAG: hypothetical protein R3Y63_04210 [Eubacteriales bacterium]
MKEQEYIIENQQVQLVINEMIEEEAVSTLLKLYFLVKASDILDLDEFIEAYLKESGILAKLEALENGESGTLSDNPNEMDFKTLSNIDMIRGNYDENNQQFYC